MAYPTAEIARAQVTRKAVWVLETYLPSRLQEIRDRTGLELKDPFRYRTLDLIQFAGDRGLWQNTPIVSFYRVFSMTAERSGACGQDEEADYNVAAYVTKDGGTVEDAQQAAEYYVEAAAAVLEEHLVDGGECGEGAPIWDVQRIGAPVGGAVRIGESLFALASTFGLRVKYRIARPVGRTVDVMPDTYRYPLGQALEDARVSLVVNGAEVEPGGVYGANSTILTVSAPAFSEGDVVTLANHSTGDRDTALLDAGGGATVTLPSLDGNVTLTVLDPTTGAIASIRVDGSGIAPLFIFTDGVFIPNGVFLENAVFTES